MSDVILTLRVRELVVGGRLIRHKTPSMPILVLSRDRWNLAQLERAAAALRRLVWEAWR